MRRIGMLMLALLLLAGCRRVAPVEPGPVVMRGARPPVAGVYTVNDLIGALQSAGLKAEPGPEHPPDDLFGAPSRDVVVEGERIRVYIYPDARTSWRTVDFAGHQVFSTLQMVIMDPDFSYIHRTLRPGNLVVRLALKDRDLVDRITSAVHTWAGPAPGESPAPRPAAPQPPDKGLSVDDLLRVLKEAKLGASLTGERRPAGPGGLTGTVVGTEGGRYIVYVFPSRQEQEVAEVPVWPTARAATAYFRHGNLLIALEPEQGELGDRLERPLAGFGRFPETGMVEQAAEFTFLRPAGYVPTQSLGPDTRTWAYDDTLVMTQKYNAEEKFYPTLENVALERLQGFGGTATAWQATTFGDRPALRVAFTGKDGRDRVLYVARRTAMVHTLTGPPEVADAVAFAARPSWQFPYRAEQVRSTFAEAGIPLPDGPLEWEMEGHRLMLSISSGWPNPEGWAAANAELYGAAEAPVAVKSRLLTALTPLRLGRGRPVWRYGCGRDTPATGGWTEVGAAISFCAGPQPATFTLMPARRPKPGSSAPVLRLTGSGEIHITANQQGRTVADVTRQLPFDFELPFVADPTPWTLTITGPSTEVMAQIAPLP